MGAQAHDLFVIPLCRALRTDTMALAEICCEKSHVRILLKDFSDKMLAKFKKNGWGFSNDGYCISCSEPAHSSGFLFGVSHFPDVWFSS